jgi:hypothetical protein
MSNEKTIANESAFARAAFYHSDGAYVREQEGLTKREYFAAMALQGVCSNQEFLKNLNAEPLLVAQGCVEIADALIKALNEEQK